MVNGHPLTVKGLSIDTPQGVLVQDECLSRWHFYRRPGAISLALPGPSKGSPGRAVFQSHSLAFLLVTLNRVLHSWPGLGSFKCPTLLRPVLVLPLFFPFCGPLFVVLCFLSWFSVSSLLFSFRYSSLLLSCSFHIHCCPFLLFSLSLSLSCPCFFGVSSTSALPFCVRFVLILVAGPGAGSWSALSP